MLMLRAAGIDSGEVIVPSFTFSATPHAVRWVGAETVFADVKGVDEPCLDPEDVERRITSSTVAVVPVDLYGIPSDYEAFDRIGTKYGLKILYDSAPAFGAKVDGRPIGGRGDAQAFSFHATKAFTTMEGGCLASRDTTLIQRAASLRNFGQIRSADCDEPGLNGKMMEICALIGLEQLDGFDSAVEHRNRIAARYRTGLRDLDGLAFPGSLPGRLPVWLYFPVFIDPKRFGLHRDDVAEIMALENLHVRKYFEMPCHHMAAYAGEARGDLPKSEMMGYSVLSLPIYNDMSIEECELFIEALRQIHRNAAEIRRRLDGRGAP